MDLITLEKAIDPLSGKVVYSLRYKSIYLGIREDTNDEIISMGFKQLGELIATKYLGDKDASQKRKE